MHQKKGASVNKEDDARFTQFLFDKAAQAKKDLGYNPTFFLGMLNAEGGFRTVSKLLAARKVSEGFTNLWEHGRLDLSVEAIVLESEWCRHFDELLLTVAEKRLRDSRYIPKRYELPPVPSPVTGAHGVQPPKGSQNPQIDTALKKAAITKQKNTISFSAHCERLGAPLANVADRWCGLSKPNRRAVFTVWADRLQGGRYVYWNAEIEDARVGARELRATIQAVMANGYDAFGILCEAQDVAALPRKRGYFHEDTLLVLRFVAEKPGLVAYVTGEVSVADVLSGAGSSIAAFPSALDDLGAVPSGVVQPDRVTRLATGYRRDDVVRRFVLRRAGGLCEYCGKFEFELPGGNHYLEAHHVIALGNQGPDKVENVIALCSHHHREAHDGRDAEKLEAFFLEKLRLLTVTI